MSPQAPNLTGKTLAGRYHLGRLLGEGGFGTVYEAIDQRLDRRVAVKVVKPWWGEDEEWAARFEQEAKLAASLNHRGIVAVHDTGRDRRAGLYIVCELIEGESLDERARRSKLSPVEVAATGADVLDALQAAHERGIIHRDIKPQNVLIANDGTVKLTDFGVARLSGGMTHSSASATIVGTPVYMSPEQARGRPVKATADLYSVGVMLYELLAGQPPFSGENHVELAMKHVSDPPAPLPTSVPGSIAAVVERALQKDPEARYPSAAAMASALRAATADPDATIAMADQQRPVDIGAAPTEPIGSRTPPRRTRRQPRPVADTPADEAATEATVPSGRRRRRAALAAVGVIIAAAIVLAIAQPWSSDSGGQSTTGDGSNANAKVSAGNASIDESATTTEPPAVPLSTVPTLRGLTEGGARARAHKHNLLLDPRRHPSRRVADGTVISQVPAPGTRVQRASTVRLTISTGPPPVDVPAVIGADVGAAQQKLAAAGLTSSTVSKSSARPTGTVLSQSTSAGERVPPGTAVQLTVAAAKSWKPVTHFTAQGESSSDIFPIRGSRWRITYTLTFGQCEFSCFPPTIYVHNKSGTDFNDFKLTEGTHTTSVPMSPGHYYVEISSVSQDPFDLDVKVEEYA